MTAVAEHVTSGRPAPAPLPAGVPGFAGVPRLAGGVELLGEYRIPVTASRRRWYGGPTARSSRSQRCCTR